MLILFYHISLLFKLFQRYISSQFRTIQCYLRYWSQQPLNFFTNVRHITTPLRPEHSNYS